MKKKYPEPPPGYKVIFRPYYVKKDGTVVYPKNGGVFPMIVPIEK
jgi:hypothetical protein